MKILDKALSWVGRRIFAATQRDHTGWFAEWAQGGHTTLSGQIVSNDKAFQLSAVYGCVRNISEDVGKIPFKIYKSLEPRGKDPLPRHRIYKLLHDQPNPEMTAMTFRQTLTGHALGWGNGFAEIERDLEGYPLYLWPLRPDRVRVFRLEDGRIWYEVRTEDDHTAWLRDDNVFHVHGLGFDGLIGYNVIRYARECLGAALATQKCASALFGSGIRTSGILKHPGKLSEGARKNLRQSFKQYQGAENAHRLMIIEEGMDYAGATTIPPEEAQFLETRQFTVSEICRWFRMPPHKVQDLLRATFDNIEHQSLEYVGDTLMPWFVRWEQEVWRKLLTPSEQRAGLFARHVVQGLLRGDVAVRYKAYQVGRNWGWLSADDVRELEDMNPLPDDKGAEYLVPLNMKEAGAETGGEQPLSFDKKFEAFIDDAAERLANTEIRRIESRIGKAAEDRKKFNEWVRGFYDSHSVRITKELMPIAEALWEQEGRHLSLEPIVQGLIADGIAAFAEGDPIDTLGTWKKYRKKDIANAIKKGLKNAITETT